MDFAISGVHVSPVYLAVVGFLVGILGGFFGVGGSFLAGPALFAAGVPMNIVVGTDLAHIVGKSIVAVKKHRTLGNVDFKLGLIMVVGTIAGVEAGAQLVQVLKREARADTVIASAFIVVLIALSVFIGWESWKTLQMQRRGLASASTTRRDASVLAHVAKAVQAFRIPPMIRLPTSEIGEVSLWVILGVAVVGGLFSGFLGGGAGYLRMPALVYVLGVPTHVAVGTDLFEVVISASYGTFTHALKGNVDILIALVMHTGAAVGAQIGATLTQKVHGAGIRLAFAPLPLLGALLMVYTLLTRH
ncbi:MAG TPA: sulfite exporter TauE/SafE family protein [Candidatus Acidoferrum sp.]|nr:sulfite exporter TauE/SafE family protein [Candidatus Acidoferrum sp.]